MTKTVERKRRRSDQLPRDPCAATARLCRQFEPVAVRAAMIRRALRTHDISAALIDCCPATTQFLESPDAQDIAAVEKQLDGQFDGLSIDDLEKAFEALVDAGRRRSQGIVYTPDFISDYLLRHALSQVGERTTPPLICDPSCGSGAFLRRAAMLIAERFGLPLVHAFRHHVIGIDTDPQALAHAQCLMELSLAAQGQTIDEGQLRLVRADTLLEEPSDFVQRLGCPHGFDIVATNPPYVKLQNLEPAYRVRLVERFEPYVKGSFSLALLFLLAGHGLLAPGGCLAYITQNNLFTSLAGEPIRRYLHEQGCVRRIIDFGHTHVFPGASAYTCLVFLGTERAAEFEYDSLREPPSSRTLAATRCSTIPLARLNPRKWRLAPGRHFDNLHRIETTGMPLGEIAQTRVGFATLKDSVFLVREIDGRCIAVGPNGPEFEIEREITRPAVKVADLDHERQIAQLDTRIIFPYEKEGGRFRLIPEADLRQRFPRAYEHLSASRRLLDSRDKGKANGAAWYAWGRAQGREAPGPKLLTKTFDSRPNFMLDRSDRLFCNGYSVSLRPTVWLPPQFTIELLQRILNSPAMHYYAKLTSFQIEGGYQCYQKNFIEKFGVPRLNRRQLDELLRLNDDAAAAFWANVYELHHADLSEIICEAGQVRASRSGEHA